jgi:hypothetical protein
VIDQPVIPVVGMVTGTAAVVIWALVLVRSLAAFVDNVEHRATFVMMAGAALLASVGSLASSIGYAIQRGVIAVDVPPDALSFIASLGRGALLMAGLIVATHYRPPARR